MQAIFLDIEATGLDPNTHHAIDIAWSIIDLTTSQELASYQSIIKQPIDAWEKRDPMSIEINGYTWETVNQGKNLQLVHHEIVEYFFKYQIARGKAMFICQNPAFDRAFFNQIVDVYTQEALGWPYHWLDLASMYWARVVQEFKAKDLPIPESFSLSKNNIAQWYNIPPEATPHRAKNGVDHLITCYEAVMDSHFVRLPQNILFHK